MPLKALSDVERIRSRENGPKPATHHVRPLPSGGKSRAAQATRCLLRQGYGAGIREGRRDMATAAPLNWGRIVASGALAGLVGSICFQVFVYLAMVLPAHADIRSFWQAAASTALGKSALASPSSAWVGAVLLLAGGIGWGIGYAYMANVRVAINKQPAISGFVFGIVVYLVMQFVLFSVQALKVPDIMSVYLGILAATVFFGVPIAFAARVK